MPQPESSPEHPYDSVAAIHDMRRHEGSTRRRILHSLPFDELGVGEVKTTFLNQPSAAETMSSPMFGAWLDAISRAVYGPGTEQQTSSEKLKAVQDHLRYLGHFALTAALASQNDIEVPVQGQNGTFMIPDYGRVAFEAKSAIAQLKDGVLTLSHDSHSITIDPQEPSQPGWEALRRVGDEFTVALNDIDPYRENL